MGTILTIIAKYLIIILTSIYTLSCFRVYQVRQKEKQESILNKQIVYMLIIHFLCYMVLFVKLEDYKIIAFYGVQTLIINLLLLFYPKIYPNASRLILNNMCFLLLIGFVMLTRLSMNNAMRQFKIFLISTVLCSIIPWILPKIKGITRFRWVYGIFGLLFLSSVFFIGTTVYGATNWIRLFGIAIQPSEFVKIIFIFFVSAMFSKSISFKNIVITTGVAVAYVLILVIEKDLGGALIFFIVYIVMLYVATGKILYFLGGLGSGTVAGFIAYHLFDHIKRRFVAWSDPWSRIENEGHQVAQSLFAIGTGGWFGMGLTEGLPTSVPVVQSDFIFAGISEELGVIVGLCLILIYISCFIMFINVAMKEKHIFYKLLALGFGVCFIFQVFLNLGGVTKFIPSTGVTLPLISYGGSSILSTIIIFNIIQGLYIISEKQRETE